MCVCVHSPMASIVVGRGNVLVSFNTAQCRYYHCLAGSIWSIGCTHLHPFSIGWLAGEGKKTRVLFCLGCGARLAHLSRSPLLLEGENQ